MKSTSHYHRAITLLTHRQSQLAFPLSRDHSRHPFRDSEGDDVISHHALPPPPLKKDSIDVHANIGAVSKEESGSFASEGQLKRAVHSGVSEWPKASQRQPAVAVAKVLSKSHLAQPNNDPVFKKRRINVTDDEQEPFLSSSKLRNSDRKTPVNDLEDDPAEITEDVTPDKKHDIKKAATLTSATSTKEHFHRTITLIPQTKAVSYHVGRKTFRDSEGDILISHHAMPVLKKNHIILNFTTGVDTGVTTTGINTGVNTLGSKRSDPVVSQPSSDEAVAQQRTFVNSDAKKTTKKSPYHRTITITTKNNEKSFSNSKSTFRDSEGNIVINHHALSALKKNYINASLNEPMNSMAGKRSSLKLNSDYSSLRYDPNAVKRSKKGKHNKRERGKLTLQSELTHAHNPKIPFRDSEGNIVISHHSLPPLKKDKVSIYDEVNALTMDEPTTFAGPTTFAKQHRETSDLAENKRLEDSDSTDKKNLVQFMDHNGKVIATIRNPLSWNSANVTLSRAEDNRRYAEELRSSGVIRRDAIQNTRGM